jgi:thymidylate synthase
MNNLDKQYTDLLQDILENGVTKSDRTGTGTLSVFGRQIRHKMTEGFPLLTTKKMPFKTITTELLWFLRGDTNIKFLVDNGCHIWDGDAYKSYSDHFIGYEDVPNKELFIEQIKTDYEFAKKWGELGPVYGKQWRSWEGLNSNTDQITNLIKDLKTNPDSRRLMVNAWNVGELDQMVLPDTLSHPEINQFNVPTRSISLMWNQRSADTFLGLPFNIASYGLLLEILAKEVNMVPDELIGNLGDTHLYSNHVEQAKEQVGREPFELPTLSQFPTYEGSRPSIESYVIGDFTLNDYQSHPSIKAPLSN